MSIQNPWWIGVACLTLAACQSVSSDRAALVGADKTAAKTAQKSAMHQSGGNNPNARRQVDTSEAGRKHFVEEHDIYGDGRVTLTEFIEFRTQRFNGGDTDGDGYLSVEEYVNEYAVRLDQRLERERKAHLDQTLARFKSLDADGDGRIQWAEFHASSERIFNRLDPQNTGAVTADASAYEQSRQRWQTLLYMPTTHRVSGFMELYDEQGSGVVTRAEFDRLRREQFDAIDTARTGSIDLQAYKSEFMARVDQRYEQVRRDQLQRAAVRFAAVDLNGNGLIDMNEYLTVGLRSFQQWDSTGTGVVSLDDPLPQAEETALQSSPSEAAGVAARAGQG